MALVDVTILSDEQLSDLLEVATNEMCRRKAIEKKEAFEKAETLMDELNLICAKYDFTFSAYNSDYCEEATEIVSIGDLEGL